jgi:hypothetical protein
MDYALWPQVARVYTLAKWVFSLFSATEVEGPAVFERLAGIFGNPGVVLVMLGLTVLGALKTARLIRRVVL